MSEIRTSMLSNKCFTGAYVLNWSHFCCIIIFWGCPIVPILHFLTISNGEGAGSNQCKKMQDWHKTDLKLTQKSLDVWISLDFHPPKRTLELKNNDSGKTGLWPPPTHTHTRPCLINSLPIVQMKGEGVKGFFKKTVELVKSVSLIHQRIIAIPYLIVFLTKCD